MSAGRGKETDEKAKEAGVPRKIDRVEIPRIVPVLPVRNTILYPSMVLPLLVAREKSIQLVNDVLLGNRMLCVLAQRDPDIEDPKVEDLYRIGTVGTILKMLKFPENQIRVLIHGVRRVRIDDFDQSGQYFKATVDPLEDVVNQGRDLAKAVSNLTKQFQQLTEKSPVLPRETLVHAKNIEDAGMLADFIATNLNLQIPDMQDILETLDVRRRVEKVSRLLGKEIEVLDLGQKIQEDVKGQIDKSQREFYLRQQMKAIRKELGEDDETQELQEFRKKIQALKLPPEVQKEAERELSRMEKMHTESAEYTVARTYLDWICELPWDKNTKDNLEIDEVKKVLDDDHYGLDRVKERILEYLAVRKLKADMKGPILCFVGPPGVGKTSLGRSIARAVGRKFERMSLGGIRDEAEIRGHRRTYVGALPGRIIRALRRAGSNNPVLMLDEVDKIGMDFRGDPSSALLEVLDPEQNNSFTDHYLDVPFDLSKVLFITTANLLDPIPPALRDRMEVLELPGYVIEEKIEIARRHIVPKQFGEHGITPDHLAFGDDAILGIIEDYTKEAGLRNMEREVATICRKVAREVATGSTQKVEINRAAVSKYLGAQKFFSEVAERTDIPGVAVGLAWTAAGGELLFIEATKMKGAKHFAVTGKLGEVMNESAQAAFAYIRSRSADFGIPEDFFEHSDIHVHIPAGAIPKDGPSAGITMASAMASLLTGKRTRSDTAMTGEITLRGKVLPVGGVKEKVLAAARGGIKRVVLPKNNFKDLEDVPAKSKEKLEFIFVETMDEVLGNVLHDWRPLVGLHPPAPVANTQPVVGN
ncbi:MAG: endopeptidase La [Deltaproteobacteria bacterium]|nr:endopeptidase La [Deltaproteobacteria bacterium]